MDELRVVGVDGVQYIVVRLGEEQYGIDIKYIDNIIRMQGITRVPKVPEYLKGVINLRGEVIPVMSRRNPTPSELLLYPMPPTSQLASDGH